ncbi:TetR/AcrR family transcriptional regulator [Paenibacillus sp. YN15]|uniref:TetR/AcrR family transcriptional regulator n=1 Tax=Paenibacillus sp. YN15 TaxID=1742774 RepID=UPI000DCCDA36|nr:helix-turn-helix domain-containing protein [Paenibacillus sp. YN15]RAV06464.1 TetR/AcrR family transcriptional regulator [Paenibacillus sp. YN15]
MTPRTKEQNEEIRLRRLAQIRKAAADVFLDKGPLLEIRDVAAQAELGYGTVYHYYSNKNDLLYDLLWDALERAGEWLEPLLKAQLKAPPEGPAAAAELGPAAAVRLLQLWAEDHALYLLYKLAGEGFAQLPDARSAPLSAAFRREVLAPFTALLEAGLAADRAAAAGGNAAEPPYRLQRAEMLLAALAGCAALSLRRGKLHEEAGEIVRFLKL